MSKCSQSSVAILVAGFCILSLFSGASAQQVVPAPQQRFLQKVPVMVPRSAAEGGGFKTEYREMQYTVTTPEQMQYQTAEMEAANEAQSLVSQLESAGES